MATETGPSALGTHHWEKLLPPVCLVALMQAAQSRRDDEQAGLRVSIDLNYRAKLWRWGQSAGAVMAGLAPQADVVFCNQTDPEAVFGIVAELDIRALRRAAHHRGWPQGHGQRRWDLARAPTGPVSAAVSWR
jgi:sugar/nucleoside kinase (ribokinase family)